MPSSLKSQIASEFKSKRGQFETYSSLGMGIDYAKLDAWLESAMDRIEKEAEKNWYELGRKHGKELEAEYQTRKLKEIQKKAFNEGYQEGCDTAVIES